MLENKITITFNAPSILRGSRPDFQHFILITGSLKLALSEPRKL